MKGHCKIAFRGCTHFLWGILLGNDWKLPCRTNMYVRCNIKMIVPLFAILLFLSYLSDISTESTKIR
jgi:hypothetical protein